MHSKGSMVNASTVAKPKRRAHRSELLLAHLLDLARVGDHLILLAPLPVLLLLLLLGLAPLALLALRALPRAAPGAGL